MKVTLEFQTEVPATLEELFDYHDRGTAFFRLIPPWESIVVIHRDSSLTVGSKTHLQIRKGFFKKDFIVRHAECDRPHGFIDEQIIGPFKSYHHDHIFTTRNNKTYLIDRLDYELPGKLFGHLIGNWYMKRAFKKMFKYRHQVIAEDFKHQKLEKPLQSKPKVLISGSHGFIGKQLCLVLELFGFDIYRLVRSPIKDPKEIYWDYKKAVLDKSSLEGFDFVIHLAGKNIASGLWTNANKKKIYDSRVDSTKALAEILNGLDNPPKAFFVASGINCYLPSHDNVSTETSEVGDSFLAKTALGLEEAASLYKHGRVIKLRFGMVLGQRGGALQKLKKLIKANLGAFLGKGDQYISWICIDDLIYQIYHLISDEKAEGIYNLVSPNPTTHNQFMIQISKVMGKKIFLRLPECLVKFCFGEMGQSLFLDSYKIKSERLQESKSYFSYPNISKAFSHLFGK